jgi:ArsR family transcriptional regulator
MVEAIQIESTVSEVDALRLLAAAAEPVRWRLLAELASQGSRCVCDLMPVGAVAPNVLSYHLKVLREAGLVTSSKRGRWVDYTLAEDAHERLRAALPTVAFRPLSMSSASSC